MNRIVKSTWTVLLLGAAAGCAGDDTEPLPATATNPAPVVKPAPESEKPGMGIEAPSPSPGTKTPDSKAGGGGDMPKVEGPKAGNAKADSTAGKLSAEELDAVKELPAAEQDVALKQLVCPVSTDHLGSMGKPVKITAEGRTFYLCCEGCEKKVKADPKAVIAKLDEKKSEK